MNAETNAFASRRLRARGLEERDVANTGELRRLSLELRDGVAAEDWRVGVDRAERAHEAGEVGG